MSNQLLFQPRRWKVYAAKAAAVAGWMLVVSANLIAFVTGRYEYWDDTVPGCNGGHESCLSVFTWQDSSVYLGTILTVAVILGLISFRRRDVP